MTYKGIKLALSIIEQKMQLSERNSDEYKFRKRQRLALLYGASYNRIHRMAKEFYHAQAL